MLYLTSFGTGVLAYQTLLQHKPITGGIYLLLFGTSVCHHAHYTETDYVGGRLIAFLDRALARLVFVRNMYMMHSSSSPSPSVMREENLPTLPTLPTLRRLRRLSLLLQAIAALIYLTRVCGDGHYQRGVFCERVRWHAVAHLLSITGALLQHALE